MFEIEMQYHHEIKARTTIDDSSIRASLLPNSHPKKDGGNPYSFQLA